MTPSSDAEWILAAVDRYESQLIRYASRLLLGDVDRARDVVQDTFLKLCRERRADLDGRVAEWLFTVCRNGALDVRRKEHRMNPSLDAGLAEPTGPEADPTLPAERADQLRRVLELLETLPASQQEVIRLKFQDGLSYREISEITRRTVNHVGVLIHHGIRALRAKTGAAPRVAPRA